MFFLRYSAFPTELHPEYNLLGEAFICCWIDEPTLAAADKVARRDIENQLWRIHEREAGEKVTEANYAEDDDWLEYYRQALTDKTVYLFHESPRFPVYWVVANVQQGEEVAEAHYFLLGASLIDEDESVAVLGFWKGARRRTALDAARTAIAEAGWKLLEIVSDKPCGREDLPEEMHLYYDETEENGAALVFVHDAQDGQPDPGGDR